MKAATSKTTNMTEGAPVRLIMMFAVPLLIGNIFQQVYSLVDTMIAGHFLGDRAIAAIGSTSVIYSLLMNITWGLTTDTASFYHRHLAQMKRVGSGILWLQ